MEKFNRFLDKINTQITQLLSNGQTEVSSAQEEISNHLYLLESMFESDLSSWLSSHSAMIKLQELETKVLQELKDKTLQYTLVPELNHLVIKNSKNTPIAHVSLQNVDKLIEVKLNLTSQTDHYQVLKFFLIKNQGLEVLALAHGLNIN